MSTRATYQFKSKPDGTTSAVTTTVYIHYDGYLTGAAVYFYKLLTQPSNGCMATQFIRANKQAELTKSHECHGDTEYRYTVTGRGPYAEIVAYERKWNSSEFVCCYVGRLADFIDKHHEDIVGWIGEYHPFKQVKNRWGTTQWYNRVTAESYLHGRYGPIDNLRVWDRRQPFGPKTRESANWQGCVSDALVVLEVFPELWTNELRQLLGEPTNVS